MIRKLAVSMALTLPTAAPAAVVFDTVITPVDGAYAEQFDLQVGLVPGRLTRVSIYVSSGDYDLTVEHSVNLSIWRNTGVFNYHDYNLYYSTYCTTYLADHCDGEQVLGFDTMEFTRDGRRTSGVMLGIDAAILAVRWPGGGGYTYVRNVSFPDGLLYVGGTADRPVRLIVNASRPTAVPEPASWALLIAGFAITGAALRQRRALAPPPP